MQRAFNLCGSPTMRVPYQSLPRGEREEGINSRRSITRVLFLDLCCERFQTSNSSPHGVDNLAFSAEGTTQLETSEADRSEGISPGIGNDIVSPNACRAKIDETETLPKDGPRA